MNNNTLHSHFKLNGKSFKSVQELLIFSESLNKSIHNFLLAWFNDEDFVIVTTSGSTGKPKPIKLKKEFMVNSAKATGAFFELPEKTTALLCLSADYIAGKMMLVRALVLGWEIGVVEASSEVKIEKKYDFSAMVPLQLRNSINHIHKIATLIVGGGVVSNDLLKQIQALPTEVFATYGMTETITHIAVKKLNHLIKGKDSASPNKNVSLRAESRSFYTTLPNVKISTDNRNCLVIDAPKVAKELIITNDVVKLISETEFEWLGRFDNVINSGGVKLHPEKIEEKLSQIIAQRFFVAGIKDEVLGEKLILLVEGVFSSTVEKSIKLAVKKLESLSKYESPKEIYFVEGFVETATKKIQRKRTLDLLKL